jgi:hypothetical protein
MNINSNFVGKLTGTQLGHNWGKRKNSAFPNFNFLISPAKAAWAAKERRRGAELARAASGATIPSTSVPPRSPEARAK